MYEFKEQDAWDFARQQGIEANQKGDQLHFKICPYCRPRNLKGNSNTFSISLRTGQFKCLRSSCGVTGNMVTLSRDFDFSLGNDVDEYYRPKKQYRRLPTPKAPIIPKDPAIAYLASRGISEEVARKYEITTNNGQDNILAFPFYDENGQLQFVKYRKTDFDKEKDNNKEWCEARCRPILFGMKQCNLANKTIILCEGQIDSLSVAEAGIENAVSVPNGAKGFTWVPYCYNWIRQFEEVIVFGDYENGEISLLEEMRKRFPNKIRHVREQDYKGCKDANEILLKHGKEAVKFAVENAEQVQIRNVIPLAQVKPVNVYELEKLETGIKELDLKLYGGLPFGAVCILTGKRGDGKSTFGSQIMANAIEKGYKTFAYSGEMTNAHYQNCFDLQIAGAQHITENNRNGIISRFITKKNLELIHAWYEEKAFIYDSRIVENDEREELLATITHTIMQYGVRVILLDNLMTAMYEDEGKYRDKYDQQGKFVRELARIALKFEVLIILISHRRKNAFSTDVNDEISGSGDISNLASVTLSYDRPSKEEVSKGHAEAGQRRLILAKNRLFGKLDLDGMLLDYDEKSRRIYGQMDDVNKRFGWDNSDGFEQINMGTPWG